MKKQQIAEKQQIEGLKQPPKIVWQGDLTVTDNNGNKNTYHLRIVNTVDNVNVMECRDNKTDAMNTIRWHPIRQIYR